MFRTWNRIRLLLSSIITDEDLAEEFGWDGGEDGYSYFMDEEEERILRKRWNIPAAVS